jgi:septal ring factor EnvC (AmiA/AmiB activator)
MIRRFPVCTLVCWLAGTAGAGDDLSARAKAAAEEIAAAGEALKEAGDGDALVRDLARAIRAYESALAVLRDNLRLAGAREAEIRAGHRQDRARLLRLFGSLYLLEARPAPVIFQHPAGPVAAAGTAQLATAATGQLTEAARAYADSLEELAALALQRDTAGSSLRRGLAELLNARAALDDAMARGDSVPRLFVDDRVQVQILAATATDLAGFAQALSALHLPDYGLAGPAGEPWLAPAEGRLLRRFGEADAAGVERPGAIIATAPLALVSAPFAATIRFAGPFLDYGNVVLLEPVAGDILVLAGIGRLFRAEGDVLQAGDPLGMMGGGDAADEEFLMVNGSETEVQPRQSLYIEFRDDDTPVDPVPLFHLE